MASRKVLEEAMAVDVEEKGLCKVEGKAGMEEEEVGGDGQEINDGAIRQLLYAARLQTCWANL